MCDLRNHNLEEVYRDGYSHESKVVRWCKDCGAIVVDIDSDGRTYSGKVSEMKFPTGKIVKDFMP